MEAKNDSATALSSASPTPPIDASSPASRRRRPNAQATYCDSWSLGGRARCGPAAPVRDVEHAGDEPGPQMVRDVVVDDEA
jgi:hypothetical protein